MNRTTPQSTETSAPSGAATTKSLVVRAIAITFIATAALVAFLATR